MTWLCLAAASFLSFSCATSCLRARYYSHLSLVGQWKLMAARETVVYPSCPHKCNNIRSFALLSRWMQGRGKVWNMAYTEWMEWLSHRKRKETKQQPGTAAPGNILGSCLVSLCFLETSTPSSVFRIKICQVFVGHGTGSQYHTDI